MLHFYSLTRLNSQFLSSRILHSQHIVTSRDQQLKLNWQNQVQSAFLLIFSLAMSSQMTEPSSPADSQLCWRRQSPARLTGAFSYKYCTNKQSRTLALFWGQNQYHPNIHFSSPWSKSQISLKGDSQDLCSYNYALTFSPNKNPYLYVHTWYVYIYTYIYTRIYQWVFRCEQKHHLASNSLLRISF